MSDPTELKPCECGELPVLLYQDGHFAACSNMRCRNKTPRFRTPDEAKADWNRRAPSTQPESEVKSCPKCGHAPHGSVRLNIASDHECSCTFASAPESSEPAREAANTGELTRVLIQALDNKQAETEQLLRIKTEAFHAAHAEEMKLQGQLSETTAERDALRAEVERLKKNRDDWCEEARRSHEDILSIARTLGCLDGDDTPVEAIERLKGELATAKEERDKWHAEASSYLADSVKLTSGFNAEVDELREQLAASEAARAKMRESLQWAMEYMDAHPDTKVTWRTDFELSYRKAKAALALTPADALKDRPKVVCLCGSSKYPAAHMRLMMQATLAGFIVIPMGLYGHADFPEGAKAATNDGDESTAVKQMLDRLHFAKIDLADEVAVVRVNGYVGSSTKREVEYAQARGKVVVWHDVEESDALKDATGWFTIAKNTGAQLERVTKERDALLEAGRNVARGYYQLEQEREALQQSNAASADALREHPGDLMLIKEVVEERNQLRRELELVTKERDVAREALQKLVNYWEDDSGHIEGMSLLVGEAAAALAGQGGQGS